MKKQLSVNVLIPAFNEENNIQNLLRDILSQKQNSFHINNIYVISDKSTDETVKNAKKIDDKRVLVKTTRKRMGKLKILNNFFKNHNNSTLIQFDADVRLQGKNVIENLVKAILKGADLASGYHKPLTPITYFEKIEYFGVEVWEEAINTLSKNIQRYHSCGQVRAFSTRLLKNFEYPENLYASEDTYLFYWVKQNNFNFHFVSQSLVLFKLPGSFQDYVKQMARFLKIKQRMSQHFNSKLINKHETLDFTHKFKSLLKFTFKKPILAILYFMVHGITKFIVLNRIDKEIWETSLTSKSLN